MQSHPIRITDQGQITIPKDMRDVIASQTVILELDPQNSNEIKIIAIPDVAGSLSAFGRGPEVDFKSEREHAWNEATSKFTKSSK